MTSPQFPSMTEVQRSITVYLRHAYPTHALPATVQARIAKLLAAGPEEDPRPAFERDGQRHVLRLGQQAYPFMKLVLEPAPHDGPLLFRADAHDRHLHAPPGSPDAAQLAHLRTINQTVVEAIEQEWTCAGLPTFRSFLREQIAARRLIINEQRSTINDAGRP